MKATKRILSILLICTMLLTLLPAAVFAADEADAASQQPIFERIGDWFRSVFTSNDPETQNADIQPFASVTHTGTVWGGAPWRLYSDGTVVVESGTINNHTNTPFSPWDARRANVTQIIFQGSHTIGPNLWRLFGQLDNLISITGMENWDTSNVTTMNGMFRNARNLISAGDLSGWDTGNVTDMSWMFEDARNLTNLDLSGWDTGNVTNMTFMFIDARNLTSVGDLSSWDTGNVTDMSFMFSATHSLTSLDLSGWDTSNVIHMTDVFSGAISLTSVGDLSGWDTSNVTHMSRMFNQTHSLTSLDLSDWDTSNVTNMTSMFSNARSLTSVGDISGWDTSSVTRIPNMFSNAHSITNLDLSGWDTSNVISMTGMFNNAHSLVTLDLSGWDTSSVPTLNDMFTDATSLRELTLGPDFSFVGGTAANLPAVPDDATFTGFWQNVGAGTVDHPQGTHVLTSAELMTTFNGATMADTWVWQRIPRIIQLNRNGTNTPFDPVPVGYPSAFQFSTIVQNVSGAPTGGLTVTISGPNASAFEITHISRAAAIGVYYLVPGGTAATLDLPSLAVGNAANLQSNRRFLIRPVAGLPAGTHTARVTVSVDAHPSGEFDEYFDVVFVVQ